MNPQELIGQQITDILVSSKMKFGWLDEAEVFIRLASGKIIGIPYDLDADEVEMTIKKEVESLFKDLSDEPIYHVNPEGKTIAEVVAAREQRASTFWGRVKATLGLGEGIPREYKPYKVEYQENKCKYLKGQRITDLLQFDPGEPKVVVELENGYLFTEVTMAPHGTGGAGLHLFSNIEELESRYGADYKRLSNYLKK